MWFLPTISEALALTEPALESEANDIRDSRAQAESEWTAAIAAVSQLLQQGTQQSPRSSTRVDTRVDSTQSQGLVLAGPCPVLDDTAVNADLQSWIFTAEPFNSLACQPQLPPATGHDRIAEHQRVRSVSLVPGDPLLAERFCLVLTADFSLVMLLGNTLAGQPNFSFSFAPESIQKAWEVLRLRILLTRSPEVGHLDSLVHQLTQAEPHYKVVMHFGRLFSKSLSAPPQVAESESADVDLSKAEQPERSPALDAHSEVVNSSPSSSLQPSHTQTRSIGDTSLSEAIGKAIHAEYFADGRAKAGQTTSGSYTDQPSYRTGPLDELSDLRESLDAKLLQAIAHDVRTPLTTINTLIRSLLRRSDLPPEVMQRLESIHRECVEQIDRFSLIFRAAELETSEHQRLPVQLTSVSLAQVLQKSVPRWQKQAARRNLTLHVALPQQMPAVVSDPTMLDQVLTGLIDRFARNLTAGSHIYLQVTLAGEQLKLQLRSQISSTDLGDQVKCSPMPLLQSIGQLLMLQPETGSLSLSLPVTKNLFQALGGKLTVKRQSQQGEVLTVFLPLGPDSDMQVK